MGGCFLGTPFSTEKKVDLKDAKNCYFQREILVQFERKNIFNVLKKEKSDICFAWKEIRTREEKT